MNHLGDIEFVDLLDGTLPPSRLAHVRACEACRQRADDMRTSIATASVDLASEPSPLFWQQFATRVNERIDAPAASPGWFTLPRLAVGMLATVAIALLAIMLLSTSTSRQVPVTAPTVVENPAPAIDDLDADADWAVVRAAAEGLDLEDAQAAGLTARPGTADRLALDLTDAERAELIRLLKHEMKSGA